MVESYTVCPNCGKEQYHNKLNCKYCGTLLYDMSEEFKESLKTEREDELLIKQQQEHNTCIERREKKRKEPMFTDEEILVTSLYPQNSFFKGLLISRILGKK